MQGASDQAPTTTTAGVAYFDPRDCRLPGRYRHGAFEKGGDVVNPLTAYAEKLVKRSERKARPQAAGKDREPTSKGHSQGETTNDLVTIDVEILLKLEENPKQRWGIGRATCTPGLECDRGILLALNRGWHPLLRRALLRTDRATVTYFAGLLLGAFTTFHSEIAVVEALEQKLKSALANIDRAKRG
jgi:hypothetical protein